MQLIEKAIALREFHLGKAAELGAFIDKANELEAAPVFFGADIAAALGEAGKNIEEEKDHNLEPTKMVEEEPEEDFTSVSFADAETEDGRGPQFRAYPTPKENCVRVQEEADSEPFAAPNLSRRALSDTQKAQIKLDFEDGKTPAAIAKLLKLHGLPVLQYCKRLKREADKLRPKEAKVPVEPQTEKQAKRKAAVPDYSNKPYQQKVNF